MFTSRVRDKLLHDYGIKNIPNELLIYLVWKEKDKYEKTSKPCDVATCAFLVANIWQKGLNTPAI